MRFYDLDIDVKNYAKRIVDAGYKCPADINSVSDFVKGLKILNIWGDVIFWPLRANQNAGNGTIAYSLGKIGIYDGTLVGSPTWGANGVWTTPTSYIEINNVFINTFILISVYRKTTNSTNGAICSSYAAPNPPAEIGYELRHDASNSPQARFYSSSSNNARTTSVNCNDGKYHFLAGITDNISAMVFADGTAGSFTSVAGTRSIPTNNFTIGRRGPTNSESVPIESSFVCIFGNYSNSISSFYSLYKSTLGKGLNLP